MGAPGAFLFTGTGALEMDGNIAVSERPETPPLDETSFTGMAVARGHITNMQTDGGESSCCCCCCYCCCCCLDACDVVALSADIILGSPRAGNLRGHVRVVPGTFETPALMLYRLRDPIIVLPGDRVCVCVGVGVCGCGWVLCV